MAPDSLLRLWRYINPLLTYLLTYLLECNVVGIFKWLMGDRSGSWMSFLTRRTLEDANSYQQAKHLLANTTLLAPAYFILGGTKSHEVIYSMKQLTLWRRHIVTALKHPVRADCVKSSFVIFWHPGTLTLRAECRSARMSKIINDILTRFGTGCFIAVTMWQQWVSKG